MPVVNRDRLMRWRDQAQARLDRLGRLVEDGADLPFTEYLARASLRARDDPEFAARLRASLRAYQLARDYGSADSNFK